MNQNLKTNTEAGAVADVAAIARRLTKAQEHVLLRCSDAEAWDDTGRGMGRRWGDITHGRLHTSFSTVNALVNHALLYEDEDGAYGLTTLGFAIYLGLRMDAKRALAADLTSQGATAS